jgi:serine/threonine-protein kinase
LSGHYRFERELGRGAFATVFLAHDLRLERPVAIKVLHVEPSSELNEIRFLQEIHFLARLQHPNIIPVHDSGHSENLLYYVMPYVRGESLRELIKRERQLPINDAVRITSELTDALDCAHAAGVIHRDIKPENILLSQTHPMLADFGVARAINVSRNKKITQTGFGSPGTPAYMSPEQLIGEPEVDKRTDIYSLGCVFFEMLVGSPPFDGEGGAVKRFTETPPSVRAARKEVSRPLDAVVTRALARMPEERYQSASEMGKALEESSSPNAKVFSSNDAEPREDRKRRRTVYAAGVTAALALVLAAVLAAKVMARSPNPSSPVADDYQRHIAVLYFDDLTPEKRLASVATGLTEDLIDQLSQVSGIRVTSPNGVRPYRYDSLPIDSIARRLNAGTLVGGSVSSSGAPLRLTVRLIDGTTGEQFHSRTFQRPARDFFSLQDSLTADVAFALRERLGRAIRLHEQRSVASSPASWQLVQEGEDLLVDGSARIRTDDDSGAARVLRRADSIFSLAEGLDAKWMTPTIDRGRLAITSAFVEPGNTKSVRAALTRAVNFASHVLAKSKDDPEALSVRGEARLRQLTFGIESQPESVLRLAQADLQNAVSSRPDLARTWTLLGEVYWNQGNFADAADAYKSAYDADAFLTEGRAVRQMLITTNLNAGRFDDARRWCNEAQKHYPDDLRFFECQLVILGWSGTSRADVATAWEKLRDAERRDSARLLTSNARFRRMMVAAVLARAGLRDSARSVVSQAPAAADQIRAAGTADAYVHVLLGEKREAITVLDRLVSESPQVRPVVRRSPWFRDIHTEPEFRRLVEGSR